MNGEILTKEDQKWLTEQHKSLKYMFIYSIFLLSLFVLGLLFCFNPENYLSANYEKVMSWSLCSFIIAVYLAYDREARSKYLKIIDKLTAKH